MPLGVELASEKVAELVKSFEHVNEILDGFRYQLGADEYLHRVLLAIKVSLSSLMRMHWRLISSNI